MLADLPLLSLVVWVPIIGGILVLVASKDEQAPIARMIALVASVLTFILSIPLYTGFDVSTAQMQFVEKVSWIHGFNIFYYLGVDGISMPLILLTSFTTPLF
jgi:NADH-quinone oxidoreductase subunit M